MDVDAVKHRAGDTFLVLGHDRMGTGIRFLDISEESTRAGVTHKNIVFSCSTNDNRFSLKAIY